MPPVSRIILNPKIEKRVHEILLDSILKLKDQEQALEFLTDLLTPTEQVMIAKRLSIAVLLAKGYTYDSIIDILKVSKNTVANVNNVLKRSGKGYQEVISRLLREEKVRNIFLTIEEVLDILPPKGGDWSKWRQEKEKRKIKKQRPI